MFITTIWFSTCHPAVFLNLPVKKGTGAQEARRKPGPFLSVFLSCFILFHLSGWSWCWWGGWRKAVIRQCTMMVMIQRNPIFEVRAICLPTCQWFQPVPTLTMKVSPLDCPNCQLERTNHVLIIKRAWTIDKGKDWDENEVVGIDQLMLWPTISARTTNWSQKHN